MIHFRKIALALLCIAALAACVPSTGPNDSQGTGDSGGMSTVPSTFMLEVPASLVMTASKANSDPYVNVIKSFTTAFGTFMRIPAMYAVIGDAVIEQNDLSPDGVARSGISITLTQALYNRMAGLCSADYYEPDTACIGQSLRLTVTYSAPTSGIYAYRLSVLPEGSTYPFIIAWSSDKTKVLCGMGFGDGMDFELGYDGSSQLCYYKSIFSTVESSLYLKKCADGGMIVYYPSTGPGSSMGAYADDLGGYYTFAGMISGAFDTGGDTIDHTAGAGLGYANKYAAAADDLDALIALAAPAT